MDCVELQLAIYRFPDFIYKEKIKLSFLAKLLLFQDLHTKIMCGD